MSCRECVMKPAIYVMAVSFIFVLVYALAHVLVLVYALALGLWHGLRWLLGM